LKTILLVDDDANDVFLLRHAMKKAGLTNPMQVVSDGQEAIDYLKGVGKFADRETFPLPILLLMDLKLPYVMGLDVLRWIGTQPRTFRCSMTRSRGRPQTVSKMSFRVWRLIRKKS